MVSGVKVLVNKAKKVKTKKKWHQNKLSEAITRAVAEATRIAIITIAETWVERTHDGSGPKVGSPAKKQLTFDWNAQDKYSKSKTLRLEVNNILTTYTTEQADKLALVMNWLGRKGLQYLETLMTAEKETCNTNIKDC